MPADETIAGEEHRELPQPAGRAGLHIDPAAERDDAVLRLRGGEDRVVAVQRSRRGEGLGILPVVVRVEPSRWLVQAMGGYGFRRYL